MADLKFNDLPMLVQDMKVWGAKSGSFTFVISLDEKLGSDYSASVRTVGAKPFDSSRCDLGYNAFKTFDEAKAACEKFLKEKQ